MTSVRFEIPPFRTPSCGLSDGRNPMSNHKCVLAMVATALAFLPACTDEQHAAHSADSPADSTATIPPENPVTVRKQLRLILEGDIPTGEFTVVYNDMHSFHGGKTLSVNGDTLRARYLLRQGAGRKQVDSSPSVLTSDQLHALVSLLLEIEVWEQRVPRREAVRDESIAGLRTTIGEAECGIWEWYNDLGGNDRMVRVKSMLESFAGPPPNS